MNILILILVAIIAVRTFLYGVRIAAEKNIVGCAAVFLLALLTSGYALYLMFRTGA